MPVQCVKTSKRLAATFTGERTVIRVQLFVALAVVLTSKALVAPRPLTQERTFGGMGTEMACIIGDEHERHVEWRAGHG